jgi:hypothetical protein
MLRARLPLDVAIERARAKANVTGRFLPGCVGNPLALSSCDINLLWTAIHTRRDFI